MIIITRRVELELGGEKEYELKLQHIAEYLIGMWCIGADYVKVWQDNRYIASGPGMSADTNYCPIPVLVSAKTRHKIKVVLGQIVEGSTEGLLVLALSNQDYAELIENGIHIRTRSWNPRPGHSDTRDHILVNYTKTREYETLMWIPVNYKPVEAWQDWDQKQIYFQPWLAAFEEQYIPMRIRIPPKSTIKADIDRLADAIGSFEGMVVYWDLPLGETAPDLEVPLTSLTKILEMLTGEERAFQKPVVFPTWPPEAGIEPQTPAEITPVQPYPTETLPPIPLEPEIPATCRPDAGVDLGAGTAREPEPVSAKIPGTQAILAPSLWRWRAIRANDWGRLRVATERATYKAGKIEATSADAQDITLDYIATRVNFKAVALDWEVKLLTVRDWLAGKTLDDVDTIYLDRGDAYWDDIEVVAARFTCPTASETTPGKLYYIFSM